MIRTFLIFVATVSTLFANIENCEVVRPSGNYALLELTILIPGDPDSKNREARPDRTWSWMGGGRDGKFRVEDGVGIREPGGWLTVKDGKLTGSVMRVTGSRKGRGFMYSVPRRLENTLSFDCTVTDGTVTGQCTIAETVCTVSGRLTTEADLARTNRIPEDKGWPWLQGPHGGGVAAESTGVTLTGTLSGIRRAWRTEETDIGAGMGSISRSMQSWDSGTTLRTGSGSASPIVADGRLYFSYHVPAPRDSDQPEIRNANTGYQPEAAALESMLAQARESGFEGASLPSYAAEKCFQNIDDVMLCADADSGKTLWKAVVRKRPHEPTSPAPANKGHSNLQHHKLGPFNRSPAYANGRVFALGMTRMLYAFDAESGEPLWERSVSAGLTEALLAVDDLVIVPHGKKWSAFDAATGEPRWTAGPATTCTLVPWKQGGKTYLIGRSRKRTDDHPAPGHVTCYDAENRGGSLEI